MPTEYVKRILDASVYDVAEETPVEELPFLSSSLKNHVLVKREDLQSIFSFKLRGAYIKYLRPQVKIIGVEAEDSACLQAALRHDRRVKLKHTGIFADGVAVAQIGKEPFRVARQCVDEVVTATSDEICAAVKDLFDDTRSIAAPAGALALAGLKTYAARHRLKGKTLLAIQSGANVNFDRLRYVSERYEVGQHTEAILAVTIPERPGSLIELRDVFAGHDISEFNYRYANQAQANVFVGLQTIPGTRHAIKTFLKELGYPYVCETDNPAYRIFLE